MRRIQFTPDLLPSDVTGVSVYNQETREFEFKPGAIFANIVVGDEINRASPKTQSALLECMEERQVTVDGDDVPARRAVHGRRHAEPDRDGGHVPAARGPARPLHGAGVDGLPGRARPSWRCSTPRRPATRWTTSSRSPTPPRSSQLIEVVKRVHVSAAVGRYAVALVSATRSSPDLRLGASPRATLHLLRAAKAAAALDDRDYVLPDDVQKLAVPVLAHRLLVTAEAQIARRGAAADRRRHRVPHPVAGRRLAAGARAGRGPEGSEHAAGVEGTDHPRALLPGRRWRVRAVRAAVRPARPAARRRPGGRTAAGQRGRGVPDPVPDRVVARLEPARAAVGSDARVVLRLENVSRLPTGLLLLEDRIPYVLGARPRFVLDRVEPRGTRDVAYALRSEARGRYQLGPLSIRLTDPFGMCELVRSFTSTDPFVVTPVVEKLPALPLGGDWAGSGESKARSIASAGEDDVVTREYRRGDDLRRIHWRSTAHKGELMVRREEQPWESRGLLLLDTRVQAHRGEGPASSFEIAVSAAASIGVHLGRQGFALDLVTDSGRRLVASVSDQRGEQEDALLDSLAVVEASTNRSLQLAGPVLRAAGEGLTVAVLGALTVDEAAELVRYRHGAGSVLAVALDVDTWRAGSRASGPPPPTSPARSPCCAVRAGGS